jgi:M3 family oligoendopeptidase
MFRDLSGESGAYIEEMVQKELFDLETRPNKRHNAWTCCMLPHKKLPFVIGEYSGDGMETGAAVHEFGHGFAFYTAARTQSLYEFHRSTATVNEIHSKTMEHFMYPYLDIFVGDRKKEYIKNHLLQQLENLAYRCAIDEFEHRMYELPHRTRRQFCELWAEISGKYMPWKQIDREAIQAGKAWPHQTHLVEHPFYYIEYDIAQISTYEFHLKMQQNREKAWGDYLSLCRAGGSRSYLELLDLANLSNPFGEGTAERICQPIVQELAALL